MRFLRRSSVTGRPQGDELDLRGSTPLWRQIVDRWWIAYLTVGVYDLIAGSYTVLRGYYLLGVALLIVGPVFLFNARDHVHLPRLRRRATMADLDRLPDAPVNVRVRLHPHPHD